MVSLSGGSAYVRLCYGTCTKVVIAYNAFLSNPPQVRDIYDDLIVRTAEGSDAVACSKLIPCCFPRCVGVQFWLVAFAFQVLGIYMALVWLVST